MNDIFNDMDKVIAKFSDDMREMFKNYHREEVKKEEGFPKIGDDLNKQGMESDILVSALEKCEKLETENKELKDFVGYCFDLQLTGCSNTEKYEGIKNRADEILKRY